MEADEAQPGRGCIGAQPAETELVAGRQQHDNRSGRRDVREGESELNRRVDGLTGLGTWGQVGASNKEEPTRRCVLTMRHISIVASTASLRQASPMPAAQGERCSRA
jgi:hypothetical protein